MSEVRLIDANALKKALADAHINMKLTFDIATFNCVMNTIDKAPTVFKALILDDMSEDKMIEFTRAWQKFQSQKAIIVNEGSQGDLISRDALKKALKSNCKPELCHDYNSAWCEACCPHNEFEDLIDEAPTVPLPDFKEGYKQAIFDGKTNFSRPEGKWGKTFDRNGKTYHKCNRCHVSSELTLFDNFCPFCGADMREVKKNGYK